VTVAAEGPELLACVQVFPRPLRVRGARVPLAGIGSVFTRPAQRGAGLARRVLERACRDAAARGMPLALLFAGPVGWYAKQGWASWTLTRHVARPVTGRLAAAERVRRLEGPRDLAALRALHAWTSEALEGTVARDEDLWTASLRNAGNPDEDVLGAEGEARGGLAAYGRATRLGGVRLVTEWGAADGDEAEEALARVLAALLPEGGVIPNLALRPGLVARLDARGLALEAVRDPTPMMRCLDPAGLARHVGVPPPASEGESAEWLAELLPPSRLAFWPADRF
jgi:GNAT superfamily N-acetyltransferase